MRNPALTIFIVVKFKRYRQIEMHAMYQNKC